MKLAAYGGDIAISGMGVVNSILTLMIMPIFVINQGVQPIIGYNYGAKKFDRVKEAYKLAVISATVIIVAGVLSAGPLADVVSSVVTGTFIFFEMKKLDAHHQSTLINDVEDTVKNLFEEKDLINDDKIIKEL